MPRPGSANSEAAAQSAAIIRRMRPSVKHARQPHDAPNRAARADRAVGGEGERRGRLGLGTRDSRLGQIRTFDLSTGLGSSSTNGPAQRAGERQ